jgi:hypothetical protein
MKDNPRTTVPPPGVVIVKDAAVMSVLGSSTPRSGATPKKLLAGVAVVKSATGMENEPFASHPKSGGGFPVNVKVYRLEAEENDGHAIPNPTETHSARMQLVMRC